MAIVKTFEVFKNNKHQVLEFELCSDDTVDFSYDDVKANLYINGKFVAEISDLLDKANLFTDAADKINWPELQTEINA